MNLLDLILAQHPSAQPLRDFTLRDDGSGPYLAAWHLPGPPPQGVPMNESAIREYERRYRAVLKAVETQVALEVEALEVLRLVNQLEALIADTANGAMVGDSTLTKAEAQAALALLASYRAWSQTPLGEGLPSPMQVVFTRR